MRGDWIHDWVQVEMEYRAGPRPAVTAARDRRHRPAPWKALRAALFPAHDATAGFTGLPNAPAR